MEVSTDEILRVVGAQHVEILKLREYAALLERENAELKKQVEAQTGNVIGEEGSHGS